MRKRTTETFRTVPAAFYQSGDQFADRIILLMQVAACFPSFADKCAAEVKSILFPEPPKEA